MYPGRVWDSLRPGTRLRTDLETLEHIRDDFTRNEKKQKNRNFHPIFGSTVVWNLILPHGQQMTVFCKDFVKDFGKVFGKDFGKVFW